MKKEFVFDFDRGHNKDTDCGLRTAALYSPQLRKSALNNLFSSIDCLSLCPYILPSGRRYNVSNNIYNYIPL